MVPLAYITHWRQYAPWSNDIQVEQDLILSRILLEVFSDPLLSNELAFRGGTALHKLFFNPAGRYSEDIDLVRTSTGKIKNIIDALHVRLNPWLGVPKTERNSASFKLRYDFNPETLSTIKARIKIEINIRETFSVYDYLMKDFSMNSPWITGITKIRTYTLEELLATKLRALYQRKKGRDVFDLWLALKQSDLDVLKIIHIFQKYMQQENNFITRTVFENNLARKLQEMTFLDDISQLLSPELKQTHSSLRITDYEDYRITDDGEPLMTEGWSLIDAAEEIKNKLLIHLPN